MQKRLKTFGVFILMLMGITVIPCVLAKVVANKFPDRAGEMKHLNYNPDNPIWTHYVDIWADGMSILLGAVLMIILVCVAGYLLWLFSRVCGKLPLRYPIKLLWILIFLWMW